jgi:hypothetical protein
MNVNNYIYLAVTCDSLPGFVKIGTTTRLPEIRVQEHADNLQRTFEIKSTYNCMFTDCITIETEIRNELKKINIFPIQGTRDWYFEDYYRQVERVFTKIMNKFHLQDVTMAIVTLNLV